MTFEQWFKAHYGEDPYDRVDDGDTLNVRSSMRIAYESGRKVGYKEGSDATWVILRGAK